MKSKLLLSFAVAHAVERAVRLARGPLYEKAGQLRRDAEQRHKRSAADVRLR